ncbi:hypothetical protein GCM10010199_24240 [Dactylosporangium roseum]
MRLAGISAPGKTPAPELCVICGHGAYAHRVRAEAGGCALCPGSVCQPRAGRAFTTKRDPST